MTSRVRGRYLASFDRGSAGSAFELTGWKEPGVVGKLVLLVPPAKSISGSGFPAIDKNGQQTWIHAARD